MFDLPGTVGTGKYSIIEQSTRHGALSSLTDPSWLHCLASYYCSSMHPYTYQITKIAPLLQ
eukprot:843404-Amphidinium_carterae.1